MSELYVKARKRLVGWLERQLIGPARDDEDGYEIDVSPLDRYPVGVLHPLLSQEPGIDPVSEGADGNGGFVDAGGRPTSSAGMEMASTSKTDESAPGGEAPGWSAGIAEALTSDDDEDEDAPADREPGAAGEKAKPARRRRYVPPSSVGFSFCVRGDGRLRIEASAAVYVSVPEDRESDFRDKRGRFVRRYARRELAPFSFSFTGGDFRRETIWPVADLAGDPSDSPGVPVGGGAHGIPGQDAPAGRAGIDVRARPHRSGTIVTVTLFNRQTWNARMAGREANVRRVERSLFEARLRCIVERGEVVDYPRVDPGLLTDEERELELQYRERRIFAVGHGAAADWNVEPGEPAGIWSEFLPRTETPIISVAARGDADVLRLDRLAAADLPVAELRAFVGEYGAWVRDRLADASREQDERDREAAHRICERMKTAHERMLRGVEMLGAEPDAALAFRLTNRAMLRQMEHLRGKQDEPWSWRPFQLGFLLATIESTASERDDHRDALDLIWFQTGGGKTEAYLGLIAFLLVWRRLLYGEAGGGTAAIMRYTLRLLTRQQFERAAGLICALEVERRDGREANGRLGREPFSVGIWVGRGVCPNTVQAAAEIVEELRAFDFRDPPDSGHAGDAVDKRRNSLLLSRCPWCREPFDPDEGYEAVYPDFRFHCVNPKCEFGRGAEPLPCRVVDESLYAHPPSLLIATIDKFARMAWEERAGAFFGAGRDRRAPDLVLQDELHLIAGPLGSVAGLYEAGIETAIRCRGVKPKYIASTATIRLANEQSKALYGRDVAVFPPPGLSCDDSWFARVDCGRPGRLYVGYLAPLRDHAHCFAPLAASLVAAPLVVFRDDQDRDDLFEAWWTNVAYHGSLRGVGTSSNAFQSDVREFGERLIAEYVEARDGGVLPSGRTERGANGGDPIESELNRRFRETQVEQLWSRHTAEQIAETFERLGEPRGVERCLDAVLSTNMVSVGLDVARLALMVVNGQPLTTGEYVQATSRVGRGEAPGVVVANYYRSQARSLSHYESFRPYHESFYRFVEPSSVTPCTYQVRKRALHAALVVALRHAWNGLAPNEAARSFDPARPEIRRVVAELKRRIARACPEKAVEAEEHVDELLREWRDEAERCRSSSQALHYQSRDKAYARLLYAYEDGLSAPGLWPTLNSMRNVESPAVLGMS